MPGNKRSRHSERPALCNWRVAPAPCNYTEVSAATKIQHSQINKTIQRKNKDGNFISENIDLPTNFHRALIKQVKQDIVNLSKAKKKRSKKTGKKVNYFSFGKQIQSSYLGRVKAKLVSLENKKSFKISKWSPTTKFCPNCGTLNKIELDERVYRCNCGYSYDRDIHAAKNVKLFGSTKRAECLEQASVETLVSAALDLSDTVS